MIFFFDLFSDSFPNKKQRDIYTIPGVNPKIPSPIEDSPSEIARRGTAIITFPMATSIKKGVK